MPVAERIYDHGDSTGSIFAGAFRRPCKDQPGQDGVPTDEQIFCHRGLIGHVQGKAFSRVGRAFRISIHRPKPAMADGPEIAIRGADGLTLLHFDGLTRLHWVYKLLRKADAIANHNGQLPAPHRQRQVEIASEGANAAFALHDRVKRLTAKHQASLRQSGLLFEPAFDPVASVLKVLGAPTPDLSPTAFDTWLWENKGALLRRYGLAPSG